MKGIYHPGYQTGFPDPHPLALSKSTLLRDRLQQEKLLAPDDLLEPEPIDRPTLELVHTAAYLDKLESSALSVSELRRLGLPWSDALWLRSRLACGGTLLCARAALEGGAAGNLVGGSHHAFADHGEGYCLINDVAVAICKLRAEGSIDRALVIDLDVHQGNGTASIFRNVPQVFTFSMHGERNYPAHKERSDLDVGLKDAIGDAFYLAALDEHLPQVLERSRPELVFYLAGVDVTAGDRLGRLHLSECAVRQRERLVVQAIRGRGLPLAIVLGGGYAPTRERTAELHAHVFREVVNFNRTRTIEPSRTGFAVET